MPLGTSHSPARRRRTPRACACRERSSRSRRDRGTARATGARPFASASSRPSRRSPRRRVDARSARATRDSPRTPYPHTKTSVRERRSIARGADHLDGHQRGLELAGCAARVVGRAGFLHVAEEDDGFLGSILADDRGDERANRASAELDFGFQGELRLAARQLLLFDQLEGNAARSASGAAWCPARLRGTGSRPGDVRRR